VQPGRGRLRGARREEPRDVHRVEAPGAVAELAAHLDVATLGEQGLHFLAAERLQDAGNALARAGALEENRRALEQPEVVLGEDPTQQLAAASSPRRRQASSASARSEAVPVSPSATRCSRSPAARSGVAASMSRDGSCSERSKYCSRQSDRRAETSGTTP
jgi:hypothetical protein